MSKVSFLGAGSWGTALAIMLAKNGHSVTLWSAIDAEIKMLSEYREHKDRLPGVRLPETVVVTNNLEEACKGYDLVVFSVASPYVRDTAKKAADFLPEGQRILNVAKGIEDSTFKTLRDIICVEIPGAVVSVLSGPRHAEEVSIDMPTTVVVGSENEKYAVSSGIPSGEDLYLYGMADQFKYCIDWKKVTGYASIPVKVTKVYMLRWCDSLGVYHEEQQSVDRWYHVKRDYEYIQLENAKKYDLTKVDISSECFDSCSSAGFLAAGACLSKKYGDSRQHVRINAAAEYDAGIGVINSTDYRRPVIPDEDFQSSAESVVSELTVWSDWLQINGETLLSDTECSKTGKSICLAFVIPKQEIRKENIIIPEKTENRAGYKSSVKLTYSCDSHIS